MPISFFLIVAAALLLRIPARDAAKRLRTRAAAASCGRLHGTRFAFDAFSCLALLLAVWTLPAGGLSGFDLGVLRYCGLAVVATALLIDGLGLLRTAMAKPPRPPAGPER